MLHSDCGMIILDEILVAIDFGLLKEKALREILEMRPPHIHIILTGRNASDLILDMADLVTEMKEQSTRIKWVSRHKLVSSISNAQLSRPIKIAD